VTANPVSKNVNGKKVVEFSVAHNHSKEKVSYFNCSAWEKLADVIEQYVSKGTRVTVQGVVSIDKKDDKYYTKVTVLNIDFSGKAEPSTNTESQHPLSAGSSSESDDLPF
jgi:single-stranded DNA-binding protein